uniref:N-acetylneuraminate lyase n=1 Tax=Denticeps clupeoides TaxID=299321 RepID=A0AAY4DUD0_9TELE
MEKPWKRLTGLVAATFTPLTAQGEVDLSVVEPYAEYLVQKQGVKQVFLNGTTGESVSLSVEERKRLAEEWCKIGKGRLDQVVVHVGCPSLKDSRELAQHAAAAGADGIAVISPSFFKPSSSTALRMFLKEIAAAAPCLPFYYYHIPSMTSVHLPARDVVRGIEKEIPSFRGVKFSDQDLLDFGQCVSSCPSDWSLLYGVDEQLLGALAMGATGAVGSTYNYLGRKVDHMLLAFNKGDLVQARAVQVLGFGLPMNKQLMSEVSGLPLGPPRLPLLPCPEQDVRAVVGKLLSILGEE